jgi:hypothetical protein
MLDAGGKVRTDIFKPRGDIHLNASGTQIASLRIRKMLEIMVPTLAQVPAPAQVQTPPAPAKPQRTRVQAPVVVNAPPVVNAPLVAEVVNAPAVIQAPVVAVQDQVESMETDEDEILARLFFKKYGRALLDEKEKEKEKEKDDVDQIKFVIDLTDEKDEMEVVAVVKTEPIEAAEAPEIVANVTNIAKRRVSSRLERLELAKARKAINEFGKTLRKTVVIPEKEAPENVIADNDSNMSEDTSVNPVEAVNSIETAERVIAESDRRAEQIIADSDAAIEASQKEFAAEFGDTPIDEFDD